MTSPTALVTGGSSGIGLATARLLHERGFRVMITGREDMTSATPRLDLPDGITFVQADARSMTDTERVADEVRNRFGTLNTLYLNAGITRATPLGQATEDDFDQLFTVNAKGAFFTLQHVLPMLVEGSSVIITVGIAVSRGNPGFSLTAGSRGALLGMVPSLALELAPRHIRVNAVSPGAIDTPIWGKSGATDEQIATMKDAITAGIPFGRFGTSQEVAEAVAFLASDGAAYITGQNITVAGGMGV